eukprot:4522575-Pleurochrysis_carterae.AAC.2
MRRSRGRVRGAPAVGRAAWRSRHAAPSAAGPSHAFAPPPARRSSWAVGSGTTPSPRRARRKTAARGATCSPDEHAREVEGNTVGRRQDAQAIRFSAGMQTAFACLSARA